MEDLRQAARDLAWLLDRGYPEKAALKLVGDRYRLAAGLRELILRATVAREIALARRRKRVRARELVGRVVTVDGFNVLGTLAHALRGCPLIRGRDGFIRDAQKAGGRLRIAPELPAIEERLRRFFRTYPPAFLGLYLDAPIPGSGELAARLRQTLLKPLGLPGEILALREAERLALEGEVVCTADGPLIDQAGRVFDLAGHLILRVLKRPVLDPFNSPGRGRRDHSPQKD